MRIVKTNLGEKNKRAGTAAAPHTAPAGSHATFTAPEIRKLAIKSRLRLLTVCELHNLKQVQVPTIL